MKSWCGEKAATMPFGMGSTRIAVMLLAASTPALAAQSSRTPAPVPDAAPHAGAPPAVSAEPRGEVVREIDDPCTGDRWLLLRGAADRAGPGRLVLAAGPGLGRSATAEKPQAASPSWDAPSSRPVIHAGDALVVEEHTAVVDVRLEATALGRAVVGAQFQARLKIGGKVVRVVAVGARRAVFAPQIETGSEAWR